MKKVAVMGAFALIAPVFTIILLITAYYSTQSRSLFISNTEYTQAGYRLFRSVPEGKSSILGVSPQSHDARAALLKKFFLKYRSDLHAYSDYIVYQADKNGIDYRLIPAISMQESTGCKFIPENSFNCWGYGIYGDKVLRFQNYEEAIDRVTRGLKKDYYDKGLDTPQKIMHKYTPPSIILGGPWASGVEYFFEEIENPSE